MNQFEFGTATKIIFGNGKSTSIFDTALNHGKKLLLLTGRTKHDLEEKINGQNWERIIHYRLSGEPELNQIEKIVEEARKEHIDIIISIGGGSVIDAGKAVSVLITNPGDITDYLEVVGKNQPLINKPIPFIAIPTTAGTGAEVTKNAVISVKEKQVKVSLRSPYLYPTYAVVDPQLTYSMPPKLTANTGMDAFTQVIEPFVSAKANRMTDLFCREGIKKIWASLETAFVNGKDEEARENMAWGSLLGGLSLANAGLGAVHGFAGPIGGMYQASHGSVCAALLPIVTEINIRSLNIRDPENPALERYQEAGRIINPLCAGIKYEIIDGLYELKEKLNIQGLKAFGIKKTEFSVIIEKAKNASSMKANPIILTDQELEEILEKAY